MVNAVGTKTTYSTKASIARITGWVRILFTISMLFGLSMTSFLCLYEGNEPSQESVSSRTSDVVVIMMISNWSQSNGSVVVGFDSLCLRVFLVPDVLRISNATLWHRQDDGRRKTFRGWSNNCSFNVPMAHVILSTTVVVCHTYPTTPITSYVPLQSRLINSLGKLSEAYVTAF